MQNVLLDPSFEFHFRLYVLVGVKKLTFLFAHFVSFDKWWFHLLLTIVPSLTSIKYKVFMSILYKLVVCYHKWWNVKVISCLPIRLDNVTKENLLIFISIVFRCFDKVNTKKSKMFFTHNLIVSIYKIKVLLLKTTQKQKDLLFQIYDFINIYLLQYNIRFCFDQSA